MPLTKEQRGKLVEFYLEAKSVVLTKWHIVFISMLGVPQKDKLFGGIVRKFRTEGTAHSVNKGRSG